MAQYFGVGRFVPGECNCKHTITFTATLCNGCVPASGYPVTVTVSQTAGGTYSGSCSITSSGGCSLVLPAPGPCAGDYTFDVTWSATNFTSVTRTLTLHDDGTVTFTNNPQLHTTSGNICDPGDGCFDTPPSSLSVTLSTTGCSGGSGCDGPNGTICDGTYTISLVSVTNNGTRLTYSGTSVTTCTNILTGLPYSITINLSIDWGSNCAPTGASISIGVTYSACGSGPSTSTSGTYSSGTIVCPISFTASGTNSASCTTTFTVS